MKYELSVRTESQNKNYDFIHLVLNLRFFYLDKNYITYKNMDIKIGEIFLNKLCSKLLCQKSRNYVLLKCVVLVQVQMNPHMARLLSTFCHFFSFFNHNLKFSLKESFG